MYPDLLVRKNLEAPFRSAVGQLEEIADSAAKLEDDRVELRGLAVLAVAAVETAFLDALAYYHVSRPESVELDEATFTRSELFEARAPLDLILMYAARRVKRLAFRPFSEILKTFAKKTRLKDLLEISAEELHDFEAFKEIRNRMVHGQRELTTALLERPFQAGCAPAEVRLGRDQLLRKVGSAQILMDRTLDQIAATYGDYSRLAALERLWYWMFDSPVMKFERFWVADAKKDEMVALTQAEDEVQLSGGEAILLSVWRAHFNDSLGPRPLTMFSLDTTNQRKVLHLLAMTGRFRVY